MNPNWKQWSPQRDRRDSITFFVTLHSITKEPRLSMEVDALYWETLGYAAFVHGEQSSFLVKCKGV